MRAVPRPCEGGFRGTLFIDDVASKPLAVQARQLCALQEREIERVGDSKPVTFDVRVIDGVVNGTDLGLFLSGWGPCPG